MPVHTSTKQTVLYSKAWDSFSVTWPFVSGPPATGGPSPSALGSDQALWNQTRDGYNLCDQAFLSGQTSKSVALPQETSFL